MDTIKQIEKRLNALKKRFPDSQKVVRFVIEDSRDWMGEPALYIWVLFENGTPESEQTLEKVWPMERMIADDIFARKDPRFPYVRFRTDQEYEDRIAGMQ